jgi:hypothetical protein
LKARLGLQLAALLACLAVVLAASAAPKPAPAKKSATPKWKTCPAGQRFGCRQRTQGAAPPRGETLPQVCGCVPRCKAGLQVIAFQLEGTWPDGSRKGNFLCSASGPPRAAPPRAPF